MASLAELLLGKENPVAQWTNRNSNLLTGLGTSLLSDGMNFQPAQVGATLDRQAAAQKDADAKLAASQNYTVNFFRQKAPDIADMIDAGLPVSQGFQLYTDRQNAAMTGPEPIKGMEINGKLVNPITGELIGDFSSPPAGPTAPSGYRVAQDGINLEFIPGGPADPSTQAKTTEAQRRNQQLASVIAPEVATVEQNWEALTKPGDQVTGGVFSPAYQTARNSLGVIAQSYLYSVSGAAATDAEVAKIVNSVTPNPLDSKQAADDKLRRVKQMAQAVIDAGGGVDPAMGAGGDADVDAILQQYGVP
jgi:hypothetical protein